MENHVNLQIHAIMGLIFKQQTVRITLHMYAKMGTFKMKYQSLEPTYRDWHAN